jgi:hypothetical protein
MTEKKERRWARDKKLMSYLDDPTPMTLWRLRHNPKIGFPQPVKVGRLNYTDLNEIDTWMAKQAMSKTSSGRHD